MFCSGSSRDSCTAITMAMAAMTAMMSDPMNSFGFFIGLIRFPHLKNRRHPGKFPWLMHQGLVLLGAGGRQGFQELFDRVAVDQDAL